MKCTSSNRNSRMTQQIFSPTFLALLKEAQFTKEMLGTGATQIRRATYASKGIYFQAFTSLSTGLERAGKLSLMLDFYIDSGVFPDKEDVKKIGHNLQLIHSKLNAIVAKRKLTDEFLNELSGPVHLAILRVLSEFAVGARYSNINLLVNDSRQSDPISLWHTTVSEPLFETKVSKARRDTIRRNAHLAEALLGPVSSVLHTSETGSMITDMRDASYRTGMHEAVAPYTQLCVLQIIRYWTVVVSSLQYLAMNKSDDIPHFSEIFALFYNDDSYLRTRKTWEGL